MGFELQYTAKIPPAAQAVLAAKSDDELSSFGLTPPWGQVPTLLVADLRRGKSANVPEHWADTNEVFCVVPDVAFYITYSLPHGMAVSFSMKAVNIRTGLPEEDGLTDNPCQSAWVTQKPWIDGYVPKDGEAVRQFAPLRGAAEMVYDVSNAVGISPDHEWKDALSAGFYLPQDLRKMQRPSYGGFRGYGDPTLEMAFGGAQVKGLTLRGAHSPQPQPEEVGMGAGARMRQRHEDDPSFDPDSFISSPFVRLSARLVFMDQWNEWARHIGEDIFPIRTLRNLEQRQEEFESRVWQSVGGKPKSTNVDSLPTMG